MFFFFLLFFLFWFAEWDCRKLVSDEKLDICLIDYAL